MRFTGVGGTLRRPWLGGIRGVVGVAALAAGLLLGLSVMPGCGSGCPTPEQAAYLKEVESWAARSKAGIEDMRTILTEVEVRPEALIDEGWRRRLKRVLDELNRGHEEMMNVEVPTGADETHRAVVRVTEERIEANELFWQGVLDVDAELLRRSNDSRRESIHLIEDLAAAGERFCE